MAIPISSRWPVSFYSAKDWLKRWRVRERQKKRYNWCNRNPHFLWSQGVNWKEQTTDSLLALRSWCGTMAIPISSRWAVVVATVQRTRFKDEELGKNKGRKRTDVTAQAYSFYGVGVNWKEQTTDPLKSLRSWCEKMAIPKCGRWPVVVYSIKDWLWIEDHHH